MALDPIRNFLFHHPDSLKTNLVSGNPGESQVSSVKNLPRDYPEHLFEVFGESAEVGKLLILLGKIGCGGRI